jgi:hypothetical protein
MVSTRSATRRKSGGDSIVEESPAQLPKSTKRQRKLPVRAKDEPQGGEENADEEATVVEESGIVEPTSELGDVFHSAQTSPTFPKTLSTPIAASLATSKHRFFDGNDVGRSADSTEVNPNETTPSAPSQVEKRLSTAKADEPEDDSDDEAPEAISTSKTAAEAAKATQEARQAAQE